MKFNIKSKKGFTLIELLVVIGILAVLVAIAIPSVAGLIDRANVSADNSNATAMTNAIEQFTSEFELVKQDIASGILDENNLDAVQGRIFNIFEITMRSQVVHLENEDDINGYGVNINTKYPVNEKTFKSVITHYLKTTSDTFIPKQSDKAFYYSPEIGVVIVAKDGSTTDELNKVALVDEDGVSVNNKGFVTLSATPLADDIEDNNIQWINLSLNALNEKSGATTTNVYVSTDTKNQYTTLRNDVLGYQEYDSEGSGLFVPGTNEYIKITVNGKQVDATWRNLIQGDYIRIVNNTLENGSNSKSLHGELVVGEEIASIIGNNTQNSFLNGSSVESLVLKEGITSIGSVFYQSSIKKVYIPSTVTYIAPLFCVGAPLEEIVVSEDSQYFTIYNGALYTKDYKTLLRFPPNKYLDTFEMHPNTETVTDYAFSDSKIKTIIFNDAVSKVGRFSFSYAKAEHIYINENANVLDLGTFRMTSNATLHMNNNKYATLYNNCIYDKDMKTLYGASKQANGILEVANGTETIVITYNNSVKTIIIPTSVKSIRTGAIQSNVNIYYCGTKEQWEQLIPNNPDDLVWGDGKYSSLTITFNYNNQ